MTRDIEATIRFLTTAEGGRRGPVYSTYRPQFSYNGRDWDAQHEYPDAEVVNPGDTVRAFLQFTRPEVHHGNLCVGMPFEIREEARTVGKGTITAILDLPASAAARGG